MEEFSALFCDHVAGALARQHALAELLGDRSWSLDVSAGVARFGDDLSFSVQLLGTESTEDRSWLWAWANDASGFPRRSIEACTSLKARSEAGAVPLLAKPLVALGDDLSGHEIALVASALCDALPYYRGPYDGGAVYVLLEGVPESVRGPYPPRRIANVLVEVISQFSVDHRTMASRFLLDQGFEFEGAAPAWRARAADGRGLDVSFDEQGRIIEISAVEP